MVCDSTKRYRKYRRSLIKWFGGRCWKCGMKHRSKKMHFAHGKPTKLSGQGRGSWRRLYDVMRNPTCYLLLCYSCHMEFDRRNSAK